MGAYLSSYYYGEITEETVPDIEIINEEIPDEEPSLEEINDETPPVII